MNEADKNAVQPSKLRGRRHDMRPEVTMMMFPFENSKHSAKRTVASLVCMLFVVVGCSDAQAPDAYFAAQALPSDGGSLGERDFPCRSDNSCATADLTCIDETPTSTCRLLCTVGVVDTCEAGYSCRNIVSTNDGACIPTGPLGVLDEDCPCDDSAGFTCVQFDGVDGGPSTNRCRTACTFVDAGPGDCPNGEGRCRLFNNNAVDGACVEDN